MADEMDKRQNKTSDRVMRVLRMVHGEMAQAEAAAEDIITGLKFLNTLSGDALPFREIPQLDNAAIVIELDFPVAPKRSASSTLITINPAGDIFIGPAKIEANPGDIQPALNNDADGELKTIYNDMVKALDKAVTVFTNKYVPDDNDEMQSFYQNMRMAMGEVYGELMHAYETADTSNPWSWDRFNETIWTSLDTAFSALVTRYENMPGADETVWEWKDFREDLNTALCESYDDMVTEYKYGDMPVDMGVSMSVNRLDSAAALTEIAKRAVFYGLISSTEEARGNPDDPLHKAVLDGIYFGTLETGVVEEIAKPFIEGFALMEELSDGKIAYDWARVIGSSDMSLWVGAHIEDEFEYEDDEFPLLVFTVNAAGTIKYEGDPDIYDAEEEEIVEFFTDLAKSAVLARKIPPAFMEAEEELTFAEQAVLDGCYQAVEEIILAQLSASDVLDTLEALEGHLGEDFHFAVKRYDGSSDLVAIINPKGPAPVEITITADSIIKMGQKRFDALKAAEVEIVQTEMTKTAAYQKRALGKAKGFSV